MQIRKFVALMKKENTEPHPHIAVRIQAEPVSVEKEKNTF